MQTASVKVESYVAFSAECIIPDIFRVECNFGCRYFKTIDKARKPFNRCKSKHLDVELWLVEYGYDFTKNRYTATQELLDYSGTHLPKC